jgi:DnaJ-class molecular chaperone
MTRKPRMVRPSIITGDTTMERCEPCCGTGTKYRYPRSGGIHAYPCPSCNGRGEVPAKVPVAEGSKP